MIGKLYHFSSGRILYGRKNGKTQMQSELLRALAASGFINYRGKYYYRKHTRTKKLLDAFNQLGEAFAKGATAMNAFTEILFEL